MNKEKTSRDFSVQNKILLQEDTGCFAFNRIKEGPCFNCEKQ